MVALMDHGIRSIKVMEDVGEVRLAIQAMGREIVVAHPNMPMVARQVMLSMVSHW